MALADCDAAECSELSMLGSSKTGAVRAVVTVPPSRDADLYRRYAAGLFRQALLTRGDPALADHVCDVIVNEYALARMPERGEAGARYRLGPWARAIGRRCRGRQPAKQA